MEKMPFNISSAKIGPFSWGFKMPVQLLLLSLGARKNKSRNSSLPIDYYALIYID